MTFKVIRGQGQDQEMTSVPRGTIFLNNFSGIGLGVAGPSSFATPMVWTLVNGACLLFSAAFRRRRAERRRFGGFRLFYRRQLQHSDPDRPAGVLGVRWSVWGWTWTPEICREVHGLILHIGRRRRLPPSPFSCNSACGFHFWRTTTYDCVNSADFVRKRLHVLQRPTDTSSVEWAFWSERERIAATPFSNATAPPHFPLRNFPV